MSLLRFSVGNFCSIKDIVTLDLAPKLGEATALTDPVKEITEPVTAIFGPNGSGKSNLLEALQFAHDVIIRSATSWRVLDDYPTQPHFPFKLSKETVSQPSFFEFDFTIDETRYLYGFTYGRDGVVEEWLSYVPKQRWSKGFIRNRTETPEIDWNNSYITKTLQKELGKVDKRELILSVALRDEHPLLQKIAYALVSSLSFLPLGDFAQRERIQQATSLIRKKHFDLNEISLLMKAADTGIESVSLNEEKIPVETLERLYKFLKAITEFDDKSNEILSNDEAEKVIYNLVFTHSGEINSILTLSEESAGTLAWLSTAPTLLQTLREGSVLIADELDSSLHQKLIEMIIKCFTDPSINQHGAQLIFTIHNTNIIEHMDDLSLDTKSIWFMEKNQNGESSLYSLADFPNHSDANYERRYLSGRYGALPYLSPAILRGLVTTHTLEAAHESNSESPSPA
jgi:hypothetical protein